MHSTCGPILAFEAVSALGLHRLLRCSGRRNPRQGRGRAAVVGRRTPGCVAYALYVPSAEISVVGRTKDAWEVPRLSYPVCLLC